MDRLLEKNYPCKTVKYESLSHIRRVFADAGRLGTPLEFT